jgi:hypothetical protein
MSLVEMSGRYVRFQLSSQGIEALGNNLPDASFEAKAMSLDDLGVWIDLDGERSMLVKWQYLATAVVARETDVVEISEKRPIGF